MPSEVVASSLAGSRPDDCRSVTFPQGCSCEKEGDEGFLGTGFSGSDSAVARIVPDGRRHSSRPIVNTDSKMFPGDIRTGRDRHHLQVSYRPVGARDGGQRF